MSQGSFFPAETPDLRTFDIILINSSAGKDSQAMLTHLNALAAEQGVQDRIVVVHCDLGRVEWKGTRDLAAEQARHYGNPFIVVSRRQGDLLTHVEQRGMWPGPDTRYCTSDHKRAQVSRVVVQLNRAQAPAGRRLRVLNCQGIRADESSKRAKKNPYTIDKVNTNGKRESMLWYPIFGWTEQQVWDTIRTSGVRYHYAYDLGMPRLSCCFCIFAPRPALMIAGRHNPELLDEYCGVEQRTGHTFRVDVKLTDIRAALAAGEPQPRQAITWGDCE